MNEDVLKPFPCKEADCAMSFFTEDHLSVHQQAKHRKLNLDIPKGSSIIFADQTPTPTRLLNNCEELRVFDDLQNINPFEEGFRRAVEDNGDVREQTFVTYQDTLHTPQILPHIEKCSLKANDDMQPPTQIESSESSLKDENPKTSKLKQMPVPLQPKPIACATPLTAIFVAKITETEQNNNTGSVRDKLKNILLSNSSIKVDRKRKLEAVPEIFEALTRATPSGNDNEKQNNVITDSTKINLSKEMNRKRNKVEKGEFSNLKVERNRAAARRYRTKMKIQSQALQEKYEKSQKELAAVKKDYNEIKKELTHVKALLLVHKDCPVSRMQQ